MPGALKQTYFKIELNDYKRPDLKKKDLTPLNLAEFNIKYNPNYPVAIFADISGKNHPNYYVTWKEVGNAIDLVSKYLLNIFKETSDNGIVEIPRVIGILAPGDPQAYFIVLLGIMKIGSIPFAMSTRNSPAALAHLLQKTNCRNLLVPFDPVKSGNPSEQFSRDQVKGMLEIIPLEHAVCLKRMPNTFDLIPGLISEEKRFETGGILHLPEEVIPTTLNENEVPDNKTLLILHSSGSTKFPKPIYLTRATLRAGMNVQNFTNFHFKGQISCALALPPFHSMYYHVGFYPVLYDGTISGYFRPELTPDGECQNPNINSVTIMEAMKKLNCTVASFSPSILTEYAEDPSCVKFLSGMERVAYGGGPLRTDVGDLLARSGVKLSPMYGMTETGCIAEFFPLPRSAEQWEYFSFARHITPQLVPRGNNEYELVLLSSQNHRSSEEVEGQELTFQAFQTKDLLAKHPTLPLYRVIGRLDDQIMLSTSEKTNPGPLEAILCFNRSIAAALIFGRAKPQNGVIIEPSSGHEVDIKDSNAVEKYIDEIWPSFEDLNKFAPSHSRITRDFIVVIDPRVSPLPRTPKGGVARAKALEMFENEIEAIYLNSGRGLSLNSSAIKICDDQGRVSAEKTLSAIKTLIEETIGQSIKQEVDIFKHGCDSLSASQIRSKVLKICQENSTLEVFVPQNVVYQNPTAELLSNWVFHLLSNSNSAAPEIYQEFSVALNNLNSMINKHKPNASKVILITGTTGSLGSYVLDDILKNRDVKNVYALNRSHARSESEHQRHVNSFRERGLEVATLDDSRITFLSSNTVHDLPFEVRLELSESLTHILHLSYPVNFNLSLKSFEDSIILTKELAELFKKSSFRFKSTKPVFVFASSVSTLANHSAPDEEWVNEAEIDISSCLGSGYGESKRVCERILEEHAKEYGFTSVILRIAQLCGSRKNGAWNKSEWFPLLVQSGIQLGCLPDGADNIAWIPVDEAAKALNDISFYERVESDLDRKNTYRHLVHPKPVLWHNIIETLGEMISSVRSEKYGNRSPVKLVSYQEWFENLMKKSEEVQLGSSLGEIGALKLIDHFKAQLKSGGLHLESIKGFEAMGVRRLVTSKSEVESSHLTNCLPLNDSDANLWFKYWQANGLF